MLDAPPNAGVGWQGLAVVGAVNADQYVIIRGKSDTVGGADFSTIGAAGRYTTGKDGYVARLTGTTNAFRIYRHAAGVETQLATAAFTTTSGTFYVVKLLVLGIKLKAIVTDGVSSVTITATDSTYSAAQNGGVYASVAQSAGYDDHFDYIYIFSSSVITVTGLFNGQRVNFYSGSARAATGQSAGGTCSVDTVNAPLAGAWFDRAEVTDVDGVTVLRIFSGLAVYPGDTWNASVVSAIQRNPPPINPLHDGLSRIMVLTSKRLYTRILGHDLSLPAAGSLGTFRIFIEDETGREKDNIAKGEVCWILGDLGFEHDIQMVGIIDTPTVHQFPGGVQALELAGRSYGSLAAKHAFSNRVDHQFQNPYYIMTNPTNGVATLVPEMEIGPYVFSPPNNLNYVTYLPGRDAYDVSQELADMSSKPGQQWNAYDCDGQDQGETKPNLHFEPVSKGISLLPILFGKGFRVQEPEDSRQILTKAIVHYANSVAYDATDLVTIDSCFKMKFTINSPGNWWLYVDLTNVADYVVQAGDYLEYDVYYTHPQVPGGVDLYNTTAAKYLREVSVFDQWGLGAGAGKAASRLGGSGRWWHRKIPMPASWVGGSITKFLPYADPNESEIAVNISGAFNIAFRNIKFSDGQAAVRKVIYDGETSALTTATDSSVNATFTSIVGGDDPRFGIISKLLERVWMTQSQAKDFGKLACSQLGDPVTFIQGDVPPDGRWKQGQLVEVWDEEPVGKARLTGVRHREMGGIGQTHLTLLLEEEAL